MAFEHKINSGSVFPAETKDTETSRDYSGSARIECPHCSRLGDHWISGWVNEGKRGEYLGLRFNAKDEQPDAVRAAPAGGGLKRAPMAEPKPQAGVPSGDLDDDIPF